MLGYKIPFILIVMLLQPLVAATDYLEDYLSYGKGNGCDIMATSYDYAEFKSSTWSD